MGSVAGEGVLCTTECSPPALPSMMWGDGDHCYYSSVEKGRRGSARQSEMALVITMMSWGPFLNPLSGQIALH